MRTADDQSRPEHSERRTKPRRDPGKRAHHDLIFAFARSCERHDADAEGHLTRIRQVVEQIALELDFPEDEAEDLGYDAMLHDVGKLHIPPEVLNKQGELTDDERSLVEQHAILGEQMLKDRPGTRRAARIARHHHESWDGGGYPDGLAGEAIPLEARITAAADVLDALIARRSYKPAATYPDALNAVHELAGSKLDPDVVEAMMRCDGNRVLRAIFTDPTGTS